MIIATIGNTKLMIETVKDAEALIDIANRATLIESTFDAEYRDYQFVSDGEKRLSIDIVEGKKLLSLEEHQARLAERKERQSKVLEKTDSK